MKVWDRDYPLSASESRTTLPPAKLSRDVSTNQSHAHTLVSFPDPAPLRGKEGLGTLVDFLGILCVSNHVTHAYAHAHFSNKRVIRELRIVSCPGGGVWVAVTREFERDNCVISEILQSDWTIPNRAGVPRKSTKVPRPSFRVWAGRSGHETTHTHAYGRPFVSKLFAYLAITVSRSIHSMFDSEHRIVRESNIETSENRIFRASNIETSDNRIVRASNIETSDNRIVRASNIELFAHRTSKNGGILSNI